MVTSIDGNIDKWLAKVYSSFIIGLESMKIGQTFCSILCEVLTYPQIAWQLSRYLCIHNLLMIIILPSYNPTFKQELILK